jgi:hypothetical protein
MTSDAVVYVHVATYTRVCAARTDHEALIRLHAGRIVHTYQTTVVSRDVDGKLHIVTADSPNQGRAWIGLASGQLGGLLVPPFVLWDDSADFHGSGAVGNFWRGLSHADLQHIARMLQRCAAAVIVISESELPIGMKDAVGGTFNVFKKRVTNAA